MEYPVPQFVEVEARLFGLFTMRQFFILTGVFLSCFISFYIFKQWLAITFSSLLAGTAIILMFVRFGGRPMHNTVIAAIRYFWMPKFYLWQKPAFQMEEVFEIQPVVSVEEKKSVPGGAEPVPQEVLRELARGLDVTQPATPETLAKSDRPPISFLTEARERLEKLGREKLPVGRVRTNIGKEFQELMKKISKLAGAVEGKKPEAVIRAASGEGKPDDKICAFAEKAERYSNALPGTVGNMEYSKRLLQAIQLMKARCLKIPPEDQNESRLCRKTAEEIRLWMHFTEPSEEQKTRRNQLLREAGEIAELFSIK